MATHPPRVFLSYSWTDKEAADTIDEDFKVIGLRFTRDVRNLGYGQSIDEFTKDIMKHDCLVALVNDAFLRSENCILEIAVVLASFSNKVQIIPVLLDDAVHLAKPEKRLPYYDYWNKKEAEAKANHDIYKNQDSLNRLKEITLITTYIDVFLSKTMDQNVPTLTQLKAVNYTTLLTQTGYREELITEEVYTIDRITDAAQKQQKINDFFTRYNGTSVADFYRAYFTDRNGERQKAAFLFREYISKYGNHPLAKMSGAYNNLGIIQENFMRDYNAARSSYQEAIRRNNKNEWAYYNLALLLSTHFQDYTNARSYYMQAIQIVPGFSTAYVQLSYLLQKLSDHAGARDCLLKIISLGKADAGIHYDLAVLLEKHFKDYRSARYHYHIAVQLNPGFESAHYALALLLDNHFSNELGILFTTLMHYDKVLLINPKNSAAHNNIGTLYFNKLGNKLKALYHFQEAVRLDPSNKTAQENLALVKSGNNKPLSKFFSDLFYF